MASAADVGCTKYPQVDTRHIQFWPALGRRRRDRRPNDPMGSRPPRLAASVVAQYLGAAALAGAGDGIRNTFAVQPQAASAALGGSGAVISHAS
jgi:hypothetical protein